MSSEFNQRAYVSTGQLPPADTIPALLSQVYERYRAANDGEVSTVYPALAKASPDVFGLAVVDVRGNCHEEGDSQASFALMSVAKPFVLALAFQDHGIEHVIERVGIDATGLPYNSLEAISRDPHGRTNPMVNSGAITTTSLILGDNRNERWQRIRTMLSAFAGHELHIDDEIFDSASATNHRNHELAAEVDERHGITGTADDAVELYTRQSCLRVSAKDLAVMGATLADGGTNPMTGVKVVDPEIARAVLVAMTVAGLYETSGRWLMDVGLPGKSGIGGGIVTISPGKGALGTYSAQLDPAGNSVRGVLAAGDLSRAAGLDILASTPIPT